MMDSAALVSCLCLTHGRVHMLRRAVSCFLHQTYPHRELVVVCQADDGGTLDYLAGLDQPSIRSVVVPAMPRLSTGALRNVSLEAARGHYIAQWDDDDWHGPARIEAQVRALVETGRSGCVLARLLLYDEPGGAVLLSEVRAWEGSLVAERGAVPPFPDLQRGSDTVVIGRMLKGGMLVSLNRPDLYVYVQHGGNTWSRAHWEANLLPHAQPLPQDQADRVRMWLASGMD